MPNNLVKAAAKQLKRSVASVEKEWNTIMGDIIKEHNDKIAKPDPDKEYSKKHWGKLDSDGKMTSGESEGEYPDGFFGKVTNAFKKATGYKPAHSGMAEAIFTKYAEIFLEAGSVMPYRTAVKLLGKNGWKYDKQVGSHKHWTHADDTRPLVIAYHPSKDLDPGAVKDIKERIEECKELTKKKKDELKDKDEDE